MSLKWTDIEELSGVGLMGAFLLAYFRNQELSLDFWSFPAIVAIYKPRRHCPCHYREVLHDIYRGEVELSGSVHAAPAKELWIAVVDSGKSCHSRASDTYEQLSSSQPVERKLL